MRRDRRTVVTVRRSRHAIGLCLVALLLAFMPGAARAQLGSLVTGGRGNAQQPLSRDQPVTFEADRVTYDRDNGIVTASGHVIAWQNDHVLTADKVTFDRNTNIAAAEGHVVLVEPDGEVLYSDYAELTQGMRDGVLKGLRARLAENGKLIANGARRTNGDVNELSRGVYTTCDLCAKNPNAPPLWQIRASSITQDIPDKRIEYRDATVDIFGLPAFYFPYFSHADPSVKRASGFLVPSFGEAKHIGEFAALPYYWVLDGQSDATITPLVASEAGPQLDVQYRHRFNDGRLTIDASTAYDQSRPQGSLFMKGQFAYDDTWRYGFDINRASSSDYLRDFRVTGSTNILASSVYVEGFGPGAYTRLDARAYQGLVSSIDQTALPYVLPRYEYSFFGKPDALGGRTSVDISAFNVLREIGTNTQRMASQVNWERPFAGPVGDQYTLRLNVKGAAYIANDLNQQPNYSTLDSAESTHGEPRAALMMKWPWMRDAGSLGTQVIEPIVQLVSGPYQGGSHVQGIPNEDSLALSFTDMNLFALNRYNGYDRLEGGSRVDAALHAAWYSGNTIFDGLIGQSYRSHKDDTYPVGSGLSDYTSDVVARASVTPSPYFDLAGHFRFDHRTFNTHFAEGIASAGTDLFRVDAGYLWSDTDPYYLFTAPTTPAAYFKQRNEINLSARSKWRNWTLSGYMRENLNDTKPVAAGVHAAYEDECFIFNVNFDRRYTSIGGDNGASTVLFQLTFKTVGQFGFNAF